MMWILALLFFIHFNFFKYQVGFFLIHFDFFKTIEILKTPKKKSKVDNVGFQTQVPHVPSELLYHQRYYGYLKTILMLLYILMVHAQASSPTFFLSPFSSP